MKKLTLLLIAFVTVSAIAKPKVVITPGKDCPDLSKVTFDIKTKQVKNGAKIKDTYAIKVTNGAKADIKVTFTVSPRVDTDAKIKKEVVIMAASQYKTVGGSVETTKGLEKVDITVSLSDPKKYKDSCPKTSSLINQKITVE